MSLLRHPLDAVLGTATKVRLLRAMLPIARPVSLREAARLAEVSPAGALGAMDELVALGIVDRREATSQHLYTLNREHVLARPLSSLFEAEEERRQALLDALRRELAAPAVAPAVAAAAIFGSVARGDDRPDSDLDLLVVTREEHDHDAVWEALVEAGPRLRRAFGVRLSPVVMTAARLRERAGEGDGFVEAVAEESIPLIKPTIRTLIDGQTGAPQAG